MGRLEQKAFDRGYFVTSEGKVIGVRGRELKCWKDKWGYPYFKIGHADGLVAVHRMAAYQKFGVSLYSPGIQVRHKNNDPGDPRPDNVLLGTKSQNEMDKDPAVRLMAAKKAARVGRKLSDHQVAGLRRDRARGDTYKVLMARYRLTKSTVSYIVNKKTYS